MKQLNFQSKLFHLEQVISEHQSKNQAIEINY